MISRQNLLLLPVVCVFGLGLVGCSRSPEAKEASYLEKGKLWLAAHDYTRALVEFKNASGVRPQDAEPYYQIGLVYLQTKMRAGAVSSFRQALWLNPKHAGAKLKLAELMAMSSDRLIIQQAEKDLTGIVTSAPGNIDALDDLAFSELRLAKPAEAAAHLEEALKKSPAHILSAVGLARLKLQQKDPAGAEAVLQKLIVELPKAIEPRLALAQLYFQEGKPSKAQEQAELGLQLDSKSPLALLFLAEVQSAQGHKEQAGATYGRLSSLPGSGYRSIHALFLFREGKLDAALDELRKLAHADPDDRTVRSYLVAACFATKRGAEGEEILSQALRRNPEDIPALLQRSALYLQEGKYALAESDLRKVLQDQPNSAIAHYGLARALQPNGEQAARRELGEAIRLEPVFLQARLELARSFGKNDPKTALEILDQAAASQKNTLPVRETRNWVLLAMGDNPEARKEVDRGLAQKRTAELLLQDGVLKMVAKDYAGARLAAEEVLVKNPSDERAMRIVVDSFVAQKQNAKAEERLRRAVLLSPKSAPIQLMLGSWLAAHREPDQARAAFLAAKIADPRSDLAFISLARLDAEQNQIDLARQELSQVLARNGGNVTARFLMGELEEKTGDSAGAVQQYRAAIQSDENNVVVLMSLARALVKSSANGAEALDYAQKAVKLAPHDPRTQDTLASVRNSQKLMRGAR